MTSSLSLLIIVMLAQHSASWVIRTNSKVAKPLTRSIQQEQTRQRFSSCSSLLAIPNGDDDGEYNDSLMNDHYYLAYSGEPEEEVTVSEIEQDTTVAASTTVQSSEQADEDERSSTTPTNSATGDNTTSSRRRRFGFAF